MKRLIAVFVTVLFLAVACFGQQSKKSYTFHGKVEGIKEATQSLTVNGESVPGWMEAMTMDYKVDDPSILKKVKVGDQISATVYAGDYSLHKVQVDPKKKQ